MNTGLDSSAFPSPANNCKTLSRGRTPGKWRRGALECSTCFSSWNKISWPLGFGLKDKGGSAPWDPSPISASASDYTETKLNFYVYTSFGWSRSLTTFLKINYLSGIPSTLISISTRLFSINTSEVAFFFFFFFLPVLEMFSFPIILDYGLSGR